MLFNTLKFAVFFAVVYALYLVLGHKAQNRMLLAASWLFYGTWDWRFLSLLIISSVVDYYVAQIVWHAQESRRRRAWLMLSMTVNLVFLGFFKYFNFFINNFHLLLTRFGFDVPIPILHIVLPVGISFYTFQSMSYTIDIYRRAYEPTNNLWDFCLFVAFFPHLVAGPIQRASNLLVQIVRPRTITWDLVERGCFLFCWGLFQKVFIADNMAAICNPVFASGGPYNGVQVLVALYAFAAQIYCDFSGYSNMARGLANLMGFDLMVNFRTPYFATNPSEFWQRWHISLSTWLRDYLYIPLGGSRLGPGKTYRNLALTMLLGGLWHGAAWTFVIWGAYQGFLLIVHRFFENNLKRFFPSAPGGLAGRTWFWIKVVFFFHLVCLGWLLFRAQSMTQVGQMLSAIFTAFTVADPVWLKQTLSAFVLYLAILVVADFRQYRTNDPCAVMTWPLPVRTAVYVLMFFSISIFAVNHAQDFIYFQF